MTKASDNDFPSLLLTEQGSAPTTPAASHQRLYIRTSDHALVTVNSSGTVAAVGGSSGTTIQRAHAMRTSGDITANGTSWANLDTGLDLTLPAASGDIIGVDASGIWFSNAVDVYLDVATIVSASPVNMVGSGTSPNNSHTGIGAWTGVASRIDGFGGMAFYTLQSGDISGGNVVLRLRVRTNTAANKQLFAGTTIPFKWGAVNFKQ